MVIYDGFGEEFFRDFESSAKESLADMGADYEEKDKIEFEASKSFGPVTLRVDYSDFKNHIFFGSAYSAVNFALFRILNDYPFDGELKDFNQWKKDNSGYENWFFEQFPKRQGYASFNGAEYINIQDLYKNLSPGTSSFMVECIVEPKHLDNNPIFSYVDGELKNGFVWLFSASALRAKIFSASTVQSIFLNYTDFSSSSHHIAFSLNKNNNLGTLYVDGVPKTSASFSYDSIDVSINSASIGKFYLSSSASEYFFSGNLDDFRFWRNARSDELIKRNYYRTIWANRSGGLSLYYKFDEPHAIAEKVVDSSGFGLHGTFNGSFSVSLNKISGTLGNWFKSLGDPIIDLTDTQVSGFLSQQRTSGSFYDRSNSNFIFNLVPSQFIEEDGHDDMQLFLLLIARHYDKLKLYIQHLSNYLYSNEEGYNNTPDELLNLVAKNYGLDIAGVYESSKPLQYFFGEDVLSSGSLDSSIKSIRNQLRRNLVNNLIYILKTKSTQESIKIALRSLGLDQDVVNINEYSVFSGGIETSYTPKIVERRVVQFLTSSNVFIEKSVYSDVEDRSYQIRVLLNTGSVHLTSSIFSIQDNSGGRVFCLDVERENLTSSYGKARLYFSGASGSPITSSLLRLYDNEWINFTIYRPSSPSVNDKFGFHVSRYFRDEIDFHFSKSASANNGFNPTVGNVVVYLGTSGSNYFDGKMQEFRAWNKILSSSNTIEKHTRDFESLALDDYLTEISSALLSYLKLNDKKATNENVHDYSGNSRTGSLSNFSTSSEFNFPGVYLYKEEQSYSYDFGINNNKIRIRNDNKLLKTDIVENIPYVSIDVSPVVALNKEIVRWFGDLEKFNNIIGNTWNKYIDEVSPLNAYRSKFFSNKLNSKIDFSAYINMLKWFDANFTFFLQQLVPLDLSNTISNYVIEPHIFEYNKITHQFPFNKKGANSRVITAEISSAVALTASSEGVSLHASDADPGRFGASVSASAQISEDAKFDYSVITGSGVNFNRLNERKIITSYLSGSEQISEGYGNGFYILSVTGASYLKSVLNINESFRISDVRYSGDSLSSSYLSSSQGRPSNLHYTGTFNGVQDQRWLWAEKFYEELNFQNGWVGPKYDFGIGYGGGYGQLWYISNKSIKTSPFFHYSNVGTSPINESALGIGWHASVNIPEIRPNVELSEIIGGKKVLYLWPTVNSFRGVIVKPITSSTKGYFENGELAKGFGDIVEVDGYSTLNLVIVAQQVDKGSVSSGDSEVKTKVKFQFFNDDLPGELAFESIFSSSVENDGKGNLFFQTINMEHELVFDKVIDVADVEKGKGFTINFERAIPKNRFMRIYMEFTFPNSLYNTTSYRIITKGLLSKDEQNLKKDVISPQTPKFPGKEE